MRYVFLAVGALVLLTLPARAVDKKAINEAIERGVIALKKMQSDDGTWPYPQIGATALAGLTLLECDVPKSDKSVQRAAKAVRAGALRLTHTYSLSTAILFLDRLDEREDTPLIEAMLIRLLAGQTRTGAWSYDCPPSSEAEVRRLAAEIGGRVLRGSRDLSKLPAKGKRTSADLAKEIQAQLKLIGLAAAQAPLGGDNSNTQFATLALWVGRRYGVPTQAALLRIEQHFRSTQETTGDWTYLPPPPGMPAMASMPGMEPRATMTCAGLLGLACGLGAKADPKVKRNEKVAIDVSKDARIKSGLKALAVAVGKPTGWNGRGARPAAIPTAGGKAYYFFWSLERIAVILNLETIGKNDWYSWGAEVLLANQQSTGLWQGEYGEGGADTCFALLFLKKVNLADDLTRRLKGGKEISEKILKSGGVGGDALKGIKRMEKAFAVVGIGAKPGDKKPGEVVKKPSKGPRTGNNPRPAETTKPRTPAEQTADRLAKDLIRSRGQTRSGFLKALRDTKGSAYTEALAGVIPKLEGETRQLARDALADRLTRMKPITLREYFKDKDAEIRRAAALAAGQKDAKTLVPDLIRLLDDDENQVRRAAHASLKEMAGKDLGPKPGADDSERKKAIAAWQAWWKKQAGE